MRTSLYLLCLISACVAVPYYGLKAQGNQIVDGSGNVVRFRGVDRSGTEFACIGVCLSK